VWRLRLGLLFGSLAWVIAWYWDAARSMAEVWWRSETFAHGFVVYPIACWLIWRKRSELEQVSCGFSTAGFFGVLLAGFAWLLGELGGVEAARHFGFVLLVACTTWAVLGTSLAKAIAFPLTFTLLAVPVGEFMLPMLIEHTADFTVGALRLTGIPVYREGNNFVVPSGHWSVVETCSGLRYLIASVTLGLLYAYLSYRSTLRRVVFVGASIVVPIVANWVRAYAIVMIGHLSGMKYAVGVDHLLYGWLFFGIVMLFLFWIGSFWREEDVKLQSLHVPDQEGIAALRPITSNLLAGALLTAGMSIAAPLYLHFLQVTTSDSQVDFVAPVPASESGWKIAAEDSLRYRPHFLGARATVSTVYSENGRTVGLYMAYYADEQPARELISHTNGIIDSGAKQWELLSSRTLSGSPGRTESVESRIRSGTTELTVRHWYWVGGGWVLRREEVKLRQALGRLLMRGDDAAVIVVFTPSTDRGLDAGRTLDSFMSNMSPSIATSLRDVRLPAVARRSAASQ